MYGALELGDTTPLVDRAGNGVGGLETATRGLLCRTTRQRRCGQCLCSPVLAACKQLMGTPCSEAENTNVPPDQREILKICDKKPQICRCLKSFPCGLLKGTAIFKMTSQYFFLWGPRQFCLGPGLNTTRCQGKQCKSEANWDSWPLSQEGNTVGAWPSHTREGTEGTGLCSGPRSAEEGPCGAEAQPSGEGSLPFSLLRGSGAPRWKSMEQGSLLWALSVLPRTRAWAGSGSADRSWNRLVMLSEGPAAFRAPSCALYLQSGRKAE